MDAIELSRLQFGLTAAFHFLFVPLSIGLMALIALMESAHLVTGDGRWRDAARFWGKFFLINFVCGVATGYPLRWQLQANWEAYSAAVRQVFETIFALEGFIAPFLFGLVILFAFGWRLKPVYRWLVTCTLTLVLVVQASAILTLNAWMQYPVGVEFVGGRAQVAAVFELLANPLLPAKIMHTVAAACALGSAFVLAVSAGYLLRRRDLDVARRSLRLAAGFGLAALLVTAAMGHYSGQLLARYQPMKFAALEALWQTEAAPAPLTLVAWPDMASGSNRFALRLPGVLGWLAGDRPEAPLSGIDELVGRTAQRIAAGVSAKRAGAEQASGEERLSIDQYALRHGYAALIPADAPATAERIAQAARAAVPPVPAVFWAFRVMAGCWLTLFSLFAYVLIRQPSAANQAGRAALWLCVLVLPLPWLATEAGWLVCELGRQPWTITGVLPTERSGGFLAASQVAWTLAGFAAAYTLVLAINLAATRRGIQEGPGAPPLALRRHCAAPAGAAFDHCLERSGCVGCANYLSREPSQR